MAGIVGRSIGKRYFLQDGKVKVALKALDLEIKDGEFVCLLGPSGCGKTTLLNIFSGLDKEFEGTVRFTQVRGGKPNKPQPTMGYVFQEARLLPWLSVRENIRFVLNKRRQTAKSIDDWLERVGLGGYGDYYPGQLSIGMQQRVAVARALILEPEILFMDEPFSSLDELTALRLRGELLGLWRENRCTVVFVTHNPLEAVYLADRVVVMTSSPGRIVDEISVRELLPRPRDPDNVKLWELSRRAVRLLTGAGYEPAHH
jgi:ABC-type nitrate/sulfonate/bicarbonate transport system ATPase subunit